MDYLLILSIKIGFVVGDYHKIYILLNSNYSMGKYHPEDEELRKEYRDYLALGGNDTTAIGHSVAEKVVQRAKEEGISVKEWLRYSGKHGSHKSLENSVDEKEVAMAICKEVANQRVPLRHAESLIENVMRGHRYNHIYVRGKQVPLSKARSFVVGYARSLLFKYGLPAEPSEHPEILSKR